MGIAAYNRGSAALRNAIDAEQRPVEFEVMEHLNGLPKYPDAGKPFAEIQFVWDDVHNCWWAQCPQTGFGFHYQTLSEAVRRWRIQIVGWHDGIWEAQPSKEQRL